MDLQGHWFYEDESTAGTSTSSSGDYRADTTATLRGAFQGLPEGPEKCSVTGLSQGTHSQTYPVPWDAVGPSNLNQFTGGITGLGDPILDKHVQQPWKASMLSGASALRGPGGDLERLHGSPLSTEQLGRPQKHNCLDCHARFNSALLLEIHASDTGHAAFVCREDDCDARFSRQDVYLRHMLRHDPNVPRHPCQLCRTHRGSRGFKRKDHLTQHLRNYHHVALEERRNRWYDIMCDQGDCRMEFKKQSELTAHKKKEHDFSAFPCDEPGCERVGGKGYTRKRDLLKHKMNVHGEESMY